MVAVSHKRRDHDQDLHRMPAAGDQLGQPGLQRDRAEHGRDCPEDHKGEIRAFLLCGPLQSRWRFPPPTANGQVAFGINGQQAVTVPQALTCARAFSAICRVPHGGLAVISGGEQS
jgi:hypothetical protein